MTVIVSTEEWQALYCSANRVPEPTAAPPSLSEAVRWIAKLGGFLARKGDWRTRSAGALARIPAPALHHRHVSDHATERVTFW